MRIRMVYWPGLLLLASCGLFAQKLGNAVYHWQDDQGVSHYSRQPPLDRAAVQINTATGMSNSERDAIQQQLLTDPDKLPVSVHEVLLGEVEPDAALVTTAAVPWMSSLKVQ